MALLYAIILEEAKDVSRQMVSAYHSNKVGR
jgi:hypothetical protein